MSTTQLAGEPGFALAVRRALLGPLTGLVNPRIMKRAGGVDAPTFGVLYHRGRRSGREYATPLGVRWTGDTALIALTFGAEADWCRNVLAAGSCRLRWKGVEATAVEPEIVDAASIRQELRLTFRGWERFQFRLMGTRHFLRLRLRREAA